MKWVCALCCIVELALPLSQSGPWLYENGLSLPLFMEQAVSNRTSAFAWRDVIVSAAVLLAVVMTEGRRLAVRALWLPVAALVNVGVSLALPLFLLMRGIRLTQKETASPIG